MDDADFDGPVHSDPAHSDPTHGDQALYLITELAFLLQRTDLAAWPDHQVRLVRRRLDEINSRLGASTSRQCR